MEGGQQVVFVLPGVSNNSGGWRWMRQAGRQILRWMRGWSRILSAKNNKQADNGGSRRLVSLSELRRDVLPKGMDKRHYSLESLAANICLF